MAALSRILDAKRVVVRAKTQQSMVAAALRQAFIQPDRAQASQTLRHVADQSRQKWPKLAAFIDDSETDVLSHLDFVRR
jgi:transposase-like protein